MDPFALWPFDGSCSGFAFCAAAGKVVDAAKDVLDDETVRDIGKGVIRSWWDSQFHD